MQRINSVISDQWSVVSKSKTCLTTGHWPLVTVLCLLTGCSSILEKLDNINKPPPMAQVSNPKEKPDYKPMTWPMPETPPPQKQYANSLWQPGARTFFRDGRAARVGDILKVNIGINDKLQFNNQTEGKRTTQDQAAAPALLGFQDRLFHLLPGTHATSPAAPLSITGNLDTKGTGTIQRQDIINTQVAAIVTQILPNGNMVIEGKQEVTMNYDVREVGIKGVIRPQDIKSDNTVDSTQIAEARMTYTSRGQLSDMQEPRWGGQVIDAVSPF